MTTTTSRKRNTNDSTGFFRGEPTRALLRRVAAWYVENLNRTSAPAAHHDRIIRWAERHDVTSAFWTYVEFG